MPNDPVGKQFNWGALGTVLAVISMAFAAGTWVVTTRTQTADLVDRLATLEGAVDGQSESIAAIDTRTLEGLPVGAIIPWDPVVRSQAGTPTGGTRDLPNGWRVCDGTNGTPDLRDRFLMGAAAVSAAGEIGGSNRLPTQAGHDHGGTTGERVGWQQGSINWEATQGHSTPYQPTWAIVPEAGHDHGGEGRPAFYSLIYLMKIS